VFAVRVNRHSNKVHNLEVILGDSRFLQKQGKIGYGYLLGTDEQHRGTQEHSRMSNEHTTTISSGQGVLQF